MKTPHPITKPVAMKTLSNKPILPFGKTLALGLIASALATSVSQAVLRVTFDMRVTPGQAGLQELSPDGRAATFATGSTVTLELWATINGGVDADPLNETFIKAVGSFVTSTSTPGLTGALRGDALTNAGVNNVANFTGVGAKSGTPNVELSSPADQIFDVGGTSITAFTNYFGAVSNTVTGQPGVSQMIGTTALTMGVDGFTAVSFKPRIVANSGSATNRLNFSFKIDNVTLSLNGDGSPTNVNVPDPTAFVFNAAQITAITIPEPSAFGMVLLGAMGLVGFRRLGLRRS